MVKLTLLKEADLDIFEDRNLIIYGNTRIRAFLLCNIFAHFGIKVTAYCYTGKRVANGFSCLGIPIITPKELNLISSQKSNLFLQSTAYEGTDDRKERSKFNCLGLQFSDLFFGEILVSFAHVTLLKQYKNSVKYYLWIFFHFLNEIKAGLFLRLEIRREKTGESVIVLLPPKTGDYTISLTFKESQIRYTNLWHNPRKIKLFVNKYEGTKMKVLLAVREPIGQNLSALYQELSTGNVFRDWLLGQLKPCLSRKRVAVISEFERFNKDGEMNVQILWENFIGRYIYFADADEFKSNHPISIQEFMTQFKVHVLDITQYPFDNQCGYAIIKENNVEVFVYQLEKLNELIPKLSEWVGVPFEKLEKGNAAEGKWIAESYKQAQKEIEITQEYFDKCFDEPYVKHCYSEADIEKFKARWRSHIKKEPQ